ncbi:MAG: radical SAM family heme chaperone HemW [Candidatus Kapaibacterium sp.]|nr:MAG: radical SAM family heme chaperone HemW [Candidatus Kapabacteria bacterium]
MRGLYLHIPFCQHKCVYCDFYSLETIHLIEEFVETLLEEIRLRAASIQASEANSLRSGQLQFQTVFFGGGTPSLLSPKQMERIIAQLHRYFAIDADAEWTMECNPGTVTPEHLRAYRALGMNRLSYGVQSFHEDELRFLSRIHSVGEAQEAIKLSRDAGFENINLDLMFALPNQRFEQWKSTLDIAVALQTDHISAYSLIFEPGTPLNTMLQQGKVRAQNEEHDAEMYSYAIDFLGQHGYEQYEVSNFAKDGKYCAHNCLYWQGDEYVSFGPSAHGYLFGTRYWNARSLKRYTENVRTGALPLTSSEILSDKERMFERAFLELRARGIRKAEFLRDFGVSIDDALAPLLREFVPTGELRTSSERVQCTPKGYAVCDALTVEAIHLLEKYCGVEWKQPQESEEIV